MESIIQSQGTLWNIYPELLYQGLQTGDEHSPLMMHAAQNYCDGQRKGGGPRKRDVNLFRCSQAVFHLQ